MTGVEYYNVLKSVNALKIVLCIIFSLALELTPILEHEIKKVPGAYIKYRLLRYRNLSCINTRHNYCSLVKVSSAVNCINTCM